MAWPALGALCCALSALLAVIAAPARALDYEINDVRSRELAVGGMLSTADVDDRLEAKCSAKDTTICRNIVNPLAVFVRGAARRHRGHLYAGVEALLGVTAPASGFGSHPMLGVGAMVGLESASDGYRKLRAYGEVGLDAMWFNTSIFDLANAFVESGIRFQIQQFSRPHMLLHAGVRTAYNFRDVGYGVSVGVGWTFD